MGPPEVVAGKEAFSRESGRVATLALLPVRDRRRRDAAVPVRDQRAARDLGGQPARARRSSPSSSARRCSSWPRSSSPAAGSGGRELGAAPWWVWVGGALGAFYVLGRVVTAPKLGAAALSRSSSPGRSSPRSPSTTSAGSASTRTRSRRAACSGWPRRRRRRARPLPLTPSASASIDAVATQPVDAARQLRVEGDERVGLQLRERDVLGVVGRGRGQLIRDLATRGAGAPRRRAAGSASGRSTSRRSRATSAGSSPRSTASCSERQRLGAEERRREQLVRRPRRSISSAARWSDDARRRRRTSVIGRL